MDRAAPVSKISGFLRSAGIFFYCLFLFGFGVSGGKGRVRPPAGFFFGEEEGGGGVVGGGGGWSLRFFSGFLRGGGGPGYGKSIPRRTFLRGVGAAAVGLPFLDAMAPAFAAAAKAPVRLAFLYVPNGIDMKNWNLEQEGAFGAFPA